MYGHGKLKVGLVGYIRKGVVCVWYKFLDIYGLNQEEFSSYVEESGDIESLRAYTAWCMVVQTQTPAVSLPTSFQCFSASEISLTSWSQRLLEIKPLYQWFSPYEEIGAQ